MLVTTQTRGTRLLARTIAWLSPYISETPRQPGPPDAFEATPPPEKHLLFDTCQLPAHVDMRIVLIDEYIVDGMCPCATPAQEGCS